MPADANSERALARLARRQHGLLTLAQLQAAGVSVDQRKRRVRSGRWLAVAPGVVAVAGTAATWRQRTLAAVLAAGPGAVASHTTAAALFGLSCCPFRGVEITVVRGRSHRSRLARVHETLVLPSGDITAIDRIPVTRPARTLVDLAGSVSRSVLEEAVDDALVRRLTTLARLEERAAALAGSGRPGTALLRTVLATWNDGALPEEVAEMRLVRRLVAHGLPAPVRQHTVRDGAGRAVARVDLAYPAERIALELDGFRWHGTPRAHGRDASRRRRLAVVGWIVVPATPVDLAGDGARLAADVAGARAAIHAAGRGA